MIQTVHYYDRDPQALASCDSCGWSDLNSQTACEVFAELMELNCPRCDHRLMTVIFPTIEETRSAAQAGHPEAIKELPRLETTAARVERAERLHLRSPDQLPDLPSYPMRVDWDLEERDDEKWVVVRWGPVVIWQELAYWEGYERFFSIVGILRQRYGRLLQEVRPTPCSELYLYGDSLRARGRVQELNHELAAGGPGSGN